MQEGGKGQGRQSIGDVKMLVQRINALMAVERGVASFYGRQNESRVAHRGFLLHLPFRHTIQCFRFLQAQFTFGQQFVRPDVFFGFIVGIGSGFFKSFAGSHEMVKDGAQFLFGAKLFGDGFVGGAGGRWCGCGCGCGGSGGGGGGRGGVAFACVVAGNNKGNAQRQHVFEREQDDVFGKFDRLSCMKKFGRGKFFFDCRKGFFSSGQTFEEQTIQRRKLGTFSRVQSCMGGDHDLMGQQRVHALL